MTQLGFLVMWQIVWKDLKSLVVISIVVVIEYQPMKSLYFEYLWLYHVDY
jgi:hypothetical protein